jgi:hypothetical protein
LPELLLRDRKKKFAKGGAIPDRSPLQAFDPMMQNGCRVFSPLPYGDF